MKAVLNFFALNLFLAVIAHPDSTNSTQYEFPQTWVVSETRSNVFVVFMGDHPVVPGVSADKPLRLGFRSATTNSYDILILRPEFGYKVSAVSSSGRLIETTRKGAKCGKKFDLIRGWDRNVLDMSRTRDHPNSESPYWLVAHPEFPIGRELACPEELFKFDKPGKYTMSIELQFLSYPRSSRSTNAYLVRLPPVKLEVVKEEE